MDTAFLNEQLNYVYLMEAIKEVELKIDKGLIKKIQDAAKSKNIVKLKRAIEDVPKHDPEELKTAGEKNVKGFKKHYQMALKLMKKENAITKTLAFIYAILASILLILPSILAKLAKKLIDATIAIGLFNGSIMVLFGMFFLYLSQCAAFLGLFLSLMAVTTGAVLSIAGSYIVIASLILLGLRLLFELIYNIFKKKDKHETVAISEV